jgi:site-specific DNA-cytosine methylase
MKALDLCAGLGGWTEGLLAAGYQVQGIDITAHPGYPAPLLLADVREVSGTAFRGVRLVVASPPCEEFSRHGMPWTRAKNPPPPDLSLVEACYRIAREAGAPLVLENVRTAQQWLGRAVWNWGACYLWGDGVPVLRLKVTPGNGKERLSSAARMKRAKIPFELARWVADYHHD